MLKRIIILTIPLILSGNLLASSAVSEPLNPLPEHRISASLITQFIERFHYKDTELNDAQSKTIFNEYLKTLDPNRSFFTAKDVESFKVYKTTLDDSLSKGDMEPAFNLFRVFNEHRIERAKYAINLLDTKFDFNKDENYLFDRSEASWAKGEAELNEIWRKRVKNDVLSLTLTKKSEKELKKTLRKRYQRLITRSEQFTPEDAYEIFINTYLASVEPHTGYFSPRTSKNFDIDMSLSLEGIGAALQTEDEHTVVKRIITGGPADLAGQLHADDKIVGVAQGRKNEMEDVIGWRLSDVVEKIRGPKDSVVRLQIISKDAGIDGLSREITIVRNKVKLEEQQAKKSIIEIPDGNKTAKIGVVTIPMFYMDFAAYARGDKDFRSTTRDTHKLIDELVAENVDGVLIDLRNNGGGSLVEAVSLTGLFIKSGPVVQVRNKSGKIDLNEDEDPSISYTGPLSVLVNRYSASASEIFAGAMQDYGRATIIGEPTYGKGTVQSIVDLNRYVDEGITLGKLKLTMAQFFRVNGDSTQHRGVVPDVVFPTAKQGKNQGESSLENALPWANIKSANFKPYSINGPSFEEIKKNHTARISKDDGFKYLIAELEERTKIMDKKKLTLQKTKRKAERESMEEQQQARLNHFRISRGMKPVKKTDADDEEDKVDDKLKEELDRIEVREAAAIMIDVIASSQNKLAQRTK